MASATGRKIRERQETKQFYLEFGKSLDIDEDCGRIQFARFKESESLLINEMGFRGLMPGNHPAIVRQDGLDKP
jgi:hypothetical protein